MTKEKTNLNFRKLIRFSDEDISVIKKAAEVDGNRSLTSLVRRGALDYAKEILNE